MSEMEKDGGLTRHFLITTDEGDSEDVHMALTSAWCFRSAHITVEGQPKKVVTTLKEEVSDTDLELLREYAEKVPVWGFHDVGEALTRLLNEHQHLRDLPTE